ncbi:MAG: GNAT family N-acetyltransferase [Flavobacteriales bacterium]|jgi:putative hemolysin|nr:GNAT family N-acetyltransferase [Flavobacteriales bacterium]
MIDSENVQKSDGNPFNPRINQKILDELAIISKKYDAQKNPTETHKTTYVLNSFFEKSPINIKFTEKELKRISKDGAKILYSHYAKDYFSYLLILKLALGVRKDVKIIAPKKLACLDFLESHIIPLEKKEKGIDPLANSPAINEKAKAHLAQGGLICALPFKKTKTPLNKIEDPLDFELKDRFIDFLKQYPNDIHAILLDSNSRIRQRVFNSFLFSLTKDDFEKKELSIVIRISKKISSADQISYLKKRTFQKQLRTKLKALKCDTSKWSLKSLFVSNNNTAMESIAVETPKSLVLAEISKISEENLLIERKNFQLYLIGAKEYPNIIKEIGRLREITFRAVGEGSGKPYDLDNYDYYYKHLFIWDKEKEMIVGSYRVGFGDEIMSKYGKPGFYTYELFRYKSEMNRYLDQSMELGRSFIRQEYQKHPITLMFLWQGILQLLIRFENNRYLFGAVSISNSYSRISKELIVGFLKEHYMDQDLSNLVKPRNPFVLKKKKMVKTILESGEHNLNDLDNLIDELDQQHNRIPVLIKKYIGQNARVLGFNVDPNFSNCLDALVLLDFAKLPMETIQKFAKDENFDHQQRLDALQAKDKE